MTGVTPAKPAKIMTNDSKATETCLAAMLRRLDIDVGQNFDLNMPVIERAAEVCGRCSHKARCRDWLDRGLRGGYRSFCPNVIWLDLLPRRTTVRRDQRPTNLTLRSTNMSIGQCDKAPRCDVGHRQS